MNKKAQVTVFIVIGILILLSTSVYFFIKYRGTEIEYVEPELVPLKNFVDQCIYTTARDAVTLLALQGGYIEIPPLINANPGAYLALDPNHNFKIPYWYYNDRTIIPSREDMETQINNYILDNVEICFNNFEELQKDFEIVPEEEMEITTTIGVESVFIKIDYLLTTKSRKTAEESRISKFGAELDVPLGKMHELAKDILDSENREMFLEKFTIDVMSLASDEIPISNMEVGQCGPMVWKVADVSNALEEFMMYNLPRIRIDNTDYESFASNEGYERLHMLWQATPENYNDLSVTLAHEKDWGFDMRVRPSSGGIMRSGSQSGVKRFLSYLCINIYHFTYDVEYPVMVTIRDINALNGEQFAFNFVFPVIIDHNKGARVYEPQFEYPDFVAQQSICEEQTSYSVDVRAKDYYVWNTLEGVNITYECLMIECPLGTTDQDRTTKRLITPVPELCFNGNIRFEKPGYLTERVTLLEGETSVEGRMVPLKKLKLRINKYKNNNLVYPFPITTDERVIIEMINLDFPNNNLQTVYPSGDNTIEIVDGDATYWAEITLLKGEEIVGGYKSNFTLYYDDIKTANELDLNVVYFENLNTDEQRFQMFDFVDNSTLYAEELKPIFK